jgi:polysaccharide export outer membrane protein
MRVDGGDLLQVSVYGAPDFDKKTVRISGSGDIRLPFIGELHVAGLTIEQTQELIARKLSEGQYFNNPQVSVLVLEFISEGASVLGEVQRPGVYPLLVQARLFDLISMAGGVTPRAGKLVTITHRSNSGAPEKVTLGNEVQGSTEGNVYVEPGDTVLISKAGIVYVVGDVHLPGGFVIENGKMTVLQAVAMAQGTLATAKLDGAKLIRQGDGGQQEEVPIRLKHILASKAPDMPLQPEDILFVPGSIGKSAGKRGLEAIVQAATGMAIYGRIGY